MKKVAFIKFFNKQRRNKRNHMLNRKIIFFLLILLLFAFGCRKPPYDLAMKGQFPPEKNIKVISGKCRDCHVHKSFDEKVHMEKMPSLYQQKRYKEAKDCRACHYIDKGLNDRIWKTYNFFYHPKTIRPENAR